MQSSVLHTIDNLRLLYSQGFENNFLTSALEKIIYYQIHQDETDLQRVEETLREFESQYQMTSEEFWRRFQSGTCEDTADFIEWNALCKARQRLLARLNILKANSGRA